jgi:hypothetical protein
MNIVNKYNIFINSKNRNSGDNNNFTVNLKKPLLLSSDKTRFAAYITNLQYPYSFFSVTQYNNSFTAIFTNILTTTSVTQTVTIPESNYTISTLISQLATSLNNTFATIVNLVGTFDKGSGRCTLNLANATHTLEFIFPSSCIIGEMLGFNSTIFMPNVPQIGPKAVNVHIVNSFVLHSNIVTSSFDSENLFSTENRPSDILAVVPLTVAPGQYVYYSSLQENAIFLNLQTIDIMNFFITNNRSLFIVDNHGLEFSFTLCIIEVEVPENITFNKLPAVQTNNEPDLQELQGLKDQLEQYLKDAEKTQEK